MGLLSNFIQRQTMTGETVEAGGYRVTPISQAISFNWPRGGWVWNRPVAVQVESDSGSETIQIMDINRMAVWGMAGTAAGLTIFAALIILAAGARRKNKE